MSQKNTFTKVATVVAIGTVSMALGADLSGIVDGFGAPDFGGGGIDGSNGVTFDSAGANGEELGNLDTSTGSNGDFSSLQNGSAQTTEWMQQQYWQHVQLPNLAGPTVTPAMLNPTM